MDIRLETFPSLKRVVAMNNEGLRNTKLARYVLYTFEVPGLQVCVVEGESKHSIYDSLKSEVSAKRPVLEVQSLKWWIFCSSSVLRVLLLLGE
jgi:hypothetical protein